MQASADACGEFRLVLFVAASDLTDDKRPATFMHKPERTCKAINPPRQQASTVRI
jgi:hypothetical protein